MLFPTTRTQAGAPAARRLGHQARHSRLPVPDLRQRPGDRRVQLTGVEASGTLHIKCQRCERRWALEADSPENAYILRLLDRSEQT